MSLIHGNNKPSVQFKVLENQQQNNGYDCGLFAIANSEGFCFDDAIFEFKTEFLLNELRNI